MDNKFQKEISAMQNTINVVNNDLNKFSKELSAESQVALIAYIVVLNAEIEYRQNRITDTEFKNIVNNFYKGDTRDT